MKNGDYLYLEVEKTNDSAVSIYKKLNFKLLENKQNNFRYLCLYKKI